jgi:hypothetical protein
MPAPTVFTSSAAVDLQFGVVNETGLIVTGFTRNVAPAKAEVRDSVNNDVVAVAYSGTTAAISIEAFANGASSFNVATIASLSNVTTAGGLTGGTILVDTYNETLGQGEFKKLSIGMTQYASTLS